MTARCRDLERALHIVLPFDLIKIGSVFTIVRLDESGPGLGWLRGLLPSHKLPSLMKRPQAINFEAGNHRGLPGILLGQEEPSPASRFRAEGNRECSFDRTQSSIKREFANDHEITSLR
jgi:hypothetical protein